MENRTNGSKSRDVPDQFRRGWLDDLDGRRTLAREMRDRYQTMTDDLGGADRLSYAQRSLAERALWLEYWLASQERELANGNDFEVGKWTQACNALQGIYSKLGLQRQAKEVPDLATYLRNKAAAKEGGEQ